MEAELESIVKCESTPQPVSPDPRSQNQSKFLRIISNPVASYIISDCNAMQGWYRSTTLPT